MHQLNILNDCVDFSKVTDKEKKEFIDNILKRQLDLLLRFSRFIYWLDEVLYVAQKDVIIDYIINLDIDKIKDRLIGKKAGQEIIDITFKNSF